MYNNLCHSTAADRKCHAFSSQATAYTPYATSDELTARLPCHSCAPFVRAAAVRGRAPRGDTIGDGDFSSMSMYAHFSALSRGCTLVKVIVCIR